MHRLSSTLVTNIGFTVVSRQEEEGGSNFHHFRSTGLRQDVRVVALGIESVAAGRDVAAGMGVALRIGGVAAGMGAALHIGGVAAGMEVALRIGAVAAGRGVLGIGDMAAGGGSSRMHVCSHGAAAGSGKVQVLGSVSASDHHGYWHGDHHASGRNQGREIVYHYEHLLLRL